MALTLTRVAQRKEGNKRIADYDVTFDASYATGGLSLKPTDVGMSKKLEHVSVGSGNVSTVFYLTAYDYVNQLLLTFTGAAQTAATTNLSTLTVRLRVEGY